MDNVKTFKTDFDRLVKKGDKLLLSMKFETYPKEFENQVREQIKDKYDEFVKDNIIPFKLNYQKWYSESIAIIKQLLPDRLADFIRLYEKPKNRKSIEYGNYVMEDYLQNLVVKSGFDRKVGPEAALTQFELQLDILKSLDGRFESTLFDIRQIVMADLFDSELDAATELNKKGFSRGAGAIAGVVLEKHLAQVLENHSLKLVKSNPAISDLNDKLKSSNVYDTPTWRKIQHMGDLRNLCDHNKTNDPTKDNVSELIFGVESLIKTIF